MKYLFLFFMLITGHCYAQRLKGTVINAEDKLPVVNALVVMGSNRTYTDGYGQFSIDGGGSDSITVSHITCKTYRGIVSRAMVTISIALQPAPINLEEVKVHAHREEEFKKDSIANREFYGRQFNYTGPKVMDAFTGNAYNRQPGELISVNPLLLVRALTKKGTPGYKFRQILIRDEQQQYIDRKFNRGTVSRITQLKGDTLANFLTKYRPTYKFIKKATDYDVEIYIKDCYKKFARDGFKGDEVFGKRREKEQL
ncbi:MAG: hypothetical protein ACTHMI_01860 [Mucilaginibacter sp.]